MDLSGTPLYIKLEVDQKPKFKKGVNPEQKDIQEDGLYYCVPASVNVKIVDKNVEIAKGNISIAQYGEVVSMPADILEQNNVTIIF